jgi:hypothetical protein
VYTLLGEDGRTYRWYSTAGSLGHEVTDKPLRITGTIAKLEEWQGAKTTNLTRCKVIGPAAQPQLVPADREAV